MVNTPAHFWNMLQQGSASVPVRVGVFSDAIGGRAPEDVAERTRRAGADAVQVRLTWPGLDLLGSATDRARVRRAYERSGVEIAAIAAYVNIFDANPDRRHANRSYLADAIRIAPELGTPLVVTESGSYNPLDAWGDHPHNHSDAAWADLVAITRDLTALCAREGAQLVYEPYVNSVLDSARAARRLADEIGSPALAFVLDPAGLTTAETIGRNAAITREAFALLDGHIALVHADDVRYEAGRARWLPLGWGSLDAGTVVDGVAASGYDGAIIVEHLAEELVPEATRFVRERLQGTAVSAAEGGGARP